MTNRVRTSRLMGTSMVRLGLRAGTISLLMSSAQAYAQQITDGDTTAQTSSGIDDIVVTARRRSETLQEVPMAVTGLSGDQIERIAISDTTALFARVPNLYFTTAGGAGPTSDFSYLVIRGVGYNGGLEPATGVFIDGMYQPQLGFDVAFLDLERVEVLRGPQGTLFGRNTQAGAVSIVTRQPGQTMRGRIEAELAEFGSFRLRASASGPVSDKLAVGFAGQVSRTDGFINKADGSNYNENSSVVARTNLRWTPTERIEVLASADYNHADFNDQAFGVPLAPKRYVALVDQDEDDRKSGWGTQLTINAELTNAIKLTAQSGYRTVSSKILIDDDADVTNQASVILNPVPNSTTVPSVPLSVALTPITVSGTAQRVDLKQDFISQELRLAGETGNFDWLVGGYYFQQDMNQFRSRDVGPGVPFVSLYIRESFMEKRNGFALFAQASFRPAPGLEFTVGGRYSDETVKTGGDRVLNVSNASINAFQKNGKASFDNFSPMASLSYELTDGIRAYATFSQGWKAGGINRFPSRPNAVLPYGAETSRNYEVGLKTTLLDRRLRANIAVFNIDIEDQQLLNVVPDPNGLTPVTTVANAASSRSRGFEVDLDAAPFDGLLLNANYGYVNAKFRDFIQVGTGSSKDRSGEPFEFTPRHNFSGSATYTIALGGGNSIDLYGAYRYVDGYRVPDGSLSAVLGGQLAVPSYDRVDARIAFATGNGWRLTAFVNNLFDTFDYTQISKGQYRAAADPARYVAVLPPRQFGLNASYSF